MEHTDKIKNTTWLRDLIFTVAIIIITGLLCLAIITLTRNVEEIKYNAISYGINKYSFDSCTCYKDGGEHDFDEDGYISKMIKIDKPIYNYSGV